MSHIVKPLPPSTAHFEHRDILQKLASAHRYLAEMKGVATSIPNKKLGATIFTSITNFSN